MFIDALMYTRDTRLPVSQMALYNTQYGGIDCETEGS